MTIATLKEELLRELAAAALGDITNGRSWRSMGAGTDLIDWAAPTRSLERIWVFKDKGPGLIRAHVRHGDRLWFAPGVLPHHQSKEGWPVDLAGEREVVVNGVVYRTNDEAAVTSVHVRGPDGVMCPLFAQDDGPARFLENVLTGHVQDA